MPNPHSVTSAGSASLILTNYPTRGWCHSIEEQQKVIGRGDDADIPVPVQFRSVSRKHAAVWRDKRGLWLRDLGSRAGTRINLVWVDRMPEVKIMPGDLLNLGGSVEIQVVAGEISEGAADDDDEMIRSLPSDEPTAGGVAQGSSRLVLRKHISPAEVELMVWISRGFLDNEELGKLLFRSPHTVRTQINSILHKLGLHSRGDIIGWLKRSGHLSEESGKP